MQKPGCVSAQRVAEPRIPQRVLDEGGAVPLDRPDVVTSLPRGERDAEHPLPPFKRDPQRIGELHFTRGVRRRIPQRGKDRRSDDVPAHDRKTAAGRLGGGLLEHVADFERIGACGVGRRDHDPVAAHERIGDGRHRDDGCGSALLKRVDQPGHDRAADRRGRLDDRIPERDDDTALASREPLAVAERITESGGVRLAGVHDPQPGPRIDQGARLEFGIGVEVVLDRSLAAPGDEQHARDAGAHEFLDDVLHDRLIDDRQHLLWLRPGGRQQARAEARDGDQRVGDRHAPMLRDVTGAADAALVQRPAVARSEALE